MRDRNVILQTRRGTAIYYHVTNNLESDELQRTRSWQHLLWIWDEQCDKRLGMKPKLFSPVSVCDGPPLLGEYSDALQTIAVMKIQC